MDTDNDADVRAAWQTQSAQTLTAEEIRKSIEEMEKRMRRQRINFVLILLLISAGIVGVAILFAQPLVLAGAAASLAGLAFLGWEVTQHSRRTPVAEDGATGSLDYKRALLRHRLDFHRKRLWLRVLALTPGGVLYFLGLAAARPDLRLLIYVELATFIVGIALIVPLNRRAAAKLERQIVEIDRLR